MATLAKLPWHQRLPDLIHAWNDTYSHISYADTEVLTPQQLKRLFKTMRKVKKQGKKITRIIMKICQNEWHSAKNHYLRIGKVGNIANMINTKSRSGLTASEFFPSKPGELVRYATNDDEQKEASILTHSAWMADPPGSQNCHFLDIVKDEIGPTGVNISPDKPFDLNAQWKYLDCLLEDKYDSEIVDRIKLAHQ